MSLQGSVVVVADHGAGDVVEALRQAGAFPVVETVWADAPAAFVAVQPSAVILADAGEADGLPPTATTLDLQIKTRRGAFVPLVNRLLPSHTPALPDGLPVMADAAPERLVARLGIAMRVRTRHDTVLRRLDTFRRDGGVIGTISTRDPLEDASIIVAGRGRSYPELSVAAGRRVGLIGALSLENVLRHVKARDVDGIILGEGFPPRMIEAMLTVIAENPSLRDMPIALPAVPAELMADFAPRLPNLERLAGPPDEVLAWMMPLVRLHAFDARLGRILGSLESEGILDPDNGLLCAPAFWSDFARAVENAKKRSAQLSLARFSFGAATDARVARDTARLVSRVVRQVDFAWQDPEEDGAILCVFTDTGLGGAHLIARRIAGLLKNAMLGDDARRARIEANVTLASLKPSDTVQSLTLRVGGMCPLPKSA